MKVKSSNFKVQSFDKLRIDPERSRMDQSYNSKLKIIFICILFLTQTFNFSFLTFNYVSAQEAQPRTDLRSGTGASTSAEIVSTDSASIQASPTPTPPQLPPAEPASSSTPSANTPQPNQIDISAFINNDVTSAKFRKHKKINSLSKRVFQAKESIAVGVFNNYQENISVEIKDTDGKIIPVDLDIKHQGDDTQIKIFPPARFKPGKYTLRISDNQGNFSEQDFTWGVLGINTNKSIYSPNELAKIAIAVLDSGGHMVCDADLKLDISNPDGRTQSLTTSAGNIKVNKACAIRDFTLEPDYETNYQTSDIGSYIMNLTATTKAGQYSISDSFEVRQYVAFDVERDTATRIFPAKTYPVRLKVLANEDFEGEIRETVPESFAITPLESSLNYTDTYIKTADFANPSTSQKLNPAMPFAGSYPITLQFGENLLDPQEKSLYGKFGLIGHDGIDYELPMGTQVLAVEDGKVVLAGEGAYGTTVVIQHSWGKSYYGHLSELHVQIGDQILKGQNIGLSGDTGLSTGPHLHFGMKLDLNDGKNGYYGKTDPAPYLNRSTVWSSDSEKIISWKISLKKGDSVVLGYQYKAPQISPQFYLLGPLQFQTQTHPEGVQAQNSSHPQGENSIQNATLSATLDSTSSAQFQIESNPEGSQLASTNPQGSRNETIIFQEARQWQIAADALSFVNLGASSVSATDPDINSGTDATSYATVACSPGPCWTPPTSGLIVLFVYSREASGNNAISSVTGNSITWTQIATVQWGSSNLHRLTMFGADASGSTQGQTTIDYGANTQLGMVASFFQVTGVNLCSGVAAAFVQSPTNTDGGSAGTSGSVTLAAAADSNNRPIAAFMHAAEEATTFRTNWTELDDMQGAGPLRGVETQYRDDAFETAASATWTTSARWGGIAAEIKFDSGGGSTPTLDKLMRHGKWFCGGVEQPFTF